MKCMSCMLAAPCPGTDFWLRSIVLTEADAQVGHDAGATALRHSMLTISHVNIREGIARHANLEARAREAVPIAIRFCSAQTRFSRSAGPYFHDISKGQ